MARNPQASAEHRPGGRWTVQTDGKRRAYSPHDRNSEVVASGRELTGNKQTELVIENEGGRTASKDSSGSGPRRTKG